MKVIFLFFLSIGFTLGDYVQVWHPEFISKSAINKYGKLGYVPSQSELKFFDKNKDNYLNQEERREARKALLKKIK